MPWLAKAQSLLKDQYAAVGAAATASLEEVELALQQAIGRGIDAARPYLDKFSDKKAAISNYVAAYRNYCWDVSSVEDYKLAPFHILTTDGAVHANKTHEWHLRTIRELCQADEKIFRETTYRVIDTKDEETPRIFASRIDT